MKTILRFAFVLSFCLGYNFAAAQEVRYAGSDPTSFGTVNVGNSNTITRSIGLQNSGDLSQIDALTVTGTGFTRVGGTCTPGVTVLSGSQTCDIQLRFAPGTAGPGSGNLFIDCSTVQVGGGVTILCDSAGGNIGLIGNALAVLNVPAMSPAALTFLALLLMAAVLVTLRRRRRV